MSLRHEHYGRKENKKFSNQTSILFVSGVTAISFACKTYKYSAFERSHQDRMFAILYPPLCGKVGGFCTVEAVVEPSMIGVGESHHELTSLLSDLLIKQKRLWLVTTLSQYEVQALPSGKERSPPVPCQKECRTSSRWTERWESSCAWGKPHIFGSCLRRTLEDRQAGRQTCRLTADL